MSQDFRFDEGESVDCGSATDVISTVDARCLRCSYCLKLLPVRGHCPECGFAYVVHEPDPDAAFASYLSVFRLWQRLFVPRKLSAEDRTFGLAPGIVCCGLFFVIGHIVVTHLAASFGSSNRSAVNFITRFDAGRNGVALQVDGFALVRHFTWAVIAQVLMAIVLHCWYSFRLWRLGCGRKIGRQFCALAVSTVPSVLAIPIVASLVWQYINTRIRLPYTRLPVISKFIRSIDFGVDDIGSWCGNSRVYAYEYAFIGIVLITIPVCIAFVRQHRRFLAALESSLLSVRSDDQ